MSKNSQLQALLQARRKNLGYQQEQTQKPQQKQQAKIQKSINQQFLEKKKFLQANLFKQNLPKDQKAQQKPKQEIKGNSQAMKSAKALLEAKLNFGNQGGNSGGPIENTLPPPPGLPTLPPPPSLPNLPPPLNMPNLPPPPPLPKNLPPPPVMPNLPPPPTLPNLPPPPSLPNLPLLPILPNNNPILPPPSFNGPVQQSISSNQPILPPPPPFNPPTNQKVIPQQQIQTKTTQKPAPNDSSISSNRISSKINEQQFRSYQNKINKQHSIDKKKSIFGNEPMIKSSQKQTINQFPTQNVNVPTKDIKENEPKPLPTPKPWNEPKDKQKKRIFKQKENSITAQFFGKDVAGYLKREFLKVNDVMSYIDKKLPIMKPKEKVRYNFPSIFKGTRGQQGKFQPNFQPHQTLYLDTRTLNVSGPFLVNNLNTIRIHNESRELFGNKLKAYDIAKDPQKLHLKAIKQLADGIPSIEYSEPNLAKIFSCIRKCDALIKQKIATEDFDKCKEIKEMRSELMRLTQKYCKYPEDCSNQYESIQRMMNRIRDLEFS